MAGGGAGEVEHRPLVRAIERERDGLLLQHRHEETDEAPDLILERTHRQRATGVPANDQAVIVQVQLMP